LPSLGLIRRRCQRGHPPSIGTPGAPLDPTSEARAQGSTTLRSASTRSRNPPQTTSHKESIYLLAGTLCFLRGTGRPGAKWQA